MKQVKSSLTVLVSHEKTIDALALRIVSLNAILVIAEGTADNLKIYNDDYTHIWDDGKNTCFVVYLIF